MSYEKLYEVEEVYTPDDVSSDRERRTVRFTHASNDPVTVMRAALVALGWPSERIEQEAYELKTQLAAQPFDEGCFSLAVVSNNGEYYVELSALES